VTKAEWLTGGASSLGQVLIETADGKHHKIKARKNMLADVYDPGQLATEARAATGQQNVTIVKSELGP
jgi:hypothetical protein